MRIMLRYPVLLRVYVDEKMHEAVKRLAFDADACVSRYVRDMIKTEMKRAGMRYEKAKYRARKAAKEAAQTNPPDAAAGVGQHQDAGIIPSTSASICAPADVGSPTPPPAAPNSNDFGLK